MLSAVFFKIVKQAYFTVPKLLNWRPKVCRCFWAIKNATWSYFVRKPKLEASIMSFKCQVVVRMLFVVFEYLKMLCEAFLKSFDCQTSIFTVSSHSHISVPPLVDQLCNNLLIEQNFRFLLLLNGAALHNLFHTAPTQVKRLFRWWRGRRRLAGRARSFGRPGFGTVLGQTVAKWRKVLEVR